MAPAEPVKRGRGRPAIGPATTIRLSDHHADIARQLGAGDLSAGIRLALDAAEAVGKMGRKSPIGPNEKRPPQGPSVEVEARAGVEPTYTDLQSGTALPARYVTQCEKRRA